MLLPTHQLNSDDTEMETKTLTWLALCLFFILVLAPRKPILSALIGTPSTGW